MKKLLLPLLALASVQLYSQGIGWSYEQSLMKIKDDPYYKKFELITNKERGYDMILAYPKQGLSLIETFYFNKTTHLCFEMIITYDIDNINGIITEYNQKFVKVSELKWKDYKNDYTLEIEKKEGACFVKILSDKE